MAWNLVSKIVTLIGIFQLSVSGYYWIKGTETVIQSITVGPGFWFASTVIGCIITLVAGFHLVGKAKDYIYGKTPSGRFENLAPEIKKGMRLEEQKGFINVSRISAQRSLLSYELRKLGVESPNIEDSGKNTWMSHLISIYPLAKDGNLKKARKVLSK